MLRANRCRRQAATTRTLLKFFSRGYRRRDQTGDKLSLETKLITQEGERVVSDSYVLDGKEAEFTPKAPNGQAGKGKRTAKWVADGNGIEINENSTFDGPEGAVNIQMTRTWTLSADGKTLKIEIAAEGPNGKQQVKRTFIRK